MTYQIYYDNQHDRWQGYGVPAECDYIGCHEDIDRGLGFACEGPNCGCEMFYCYNHQGYFHDDNTSEAKPDTIDWLTMIITSPRWEEFREKYPAKIRMYQEIVGDS